jgi:phosphoribosylformimino-5-aminoimidazole carboxamide ribotide isomerase
MELFPAIDLRGGAAVRLAQGDFDRQVDYGDPLTVAKTFVAGGTTWLHVVDLNAARTGTIHELGAIEQIVAVAAENGVRVQTGGGIRTEDNVAAALEGGVARVVMGTAALEDPELANRCAERWPAQVAVGLDYVVAEDGTTQAMAHGWEEGSGRSLLELLKMWDGGPVAAVVATSIARDGMLGGSDIAGLSAVLEATTIPVIASGGVGTLADIAALAELVVEGRRLAGVIVGKALVEGRFRVEEAVAACAPSA